MSMPLSSSTACSEIVVPDNLKSGVTRPCYYEPDINPTYQDLAQHYGMAIIPARAGKARDKAKVENAVLVGERWILAALRNHTFFSIAELNQAIREKLIDLNNRPMQVLKKNSPGTVREPRPPGPQAAARHPL